MSRAVLRWSGSSIVAGCLACLSSVSIAGTTIFMYNEHTYEIIKTPRTWAAAATDAESRLWSGVPGYLTRIDDASENAAIFNQLLAAIPSTEYANTDAPDGGGGAYAWIGATDQGTEGSWLWDGDGNGSGDQFWSGGKTGSPVGGLWNNWGTVGGVRNEPDNYNNQDAAGISLNGWPKSDQHLGVASQWNDVNVGNSLYYVVEYPVPEPAGAALLALCLMLATAWRPMRHRS